MSIVNSFREKVVAGVATAALAVTSAAAPFTASAQDTKPAAAPTTRVAVANSNTLNISAKDAEAALNAATDKYEAANNYSYEKGVSIILVINPADAPDPKTFRDNVFGVMNMAKAGGAKANVFSFQTNEGPSYGFLLSKRKIQGNLYPIGKIPDMGTEITTIFKRDFPQQVAQLPQQPATVAATASITTQPDTFALQR